MTEQSSPPPLPLSDEADRPAAWWSWPVIILAVFFIGWSVNLFAPKAMEEIKEEQGMIDAGDLALFKIQSRVIIAAAPLSETDALGSLDELRSYAQNDALVMALALLEDFLGIESLKPLETLDSLSAEATPDTKALIEKSIRLGLTTEERKNLEGELGWFAELAREVEGKAPPAEKKIRLHSMIFLVLASLLFVGVALGVTVGAVLLILQLRAEKMRQLKNRFSPTALPRGVMLESFALYLGIMALGDLGGQFVHPGISYASYIVAVILPFLWPFFRGIEWRHFRRSIGWHRGDGVWREIGAGCVGYLKVMAIASIGIAITVILSAIVGSLAAAGEAGEAGAPVGPQTHPIVGWIYLGDLRERLLCFFLAAVFAPVFEELFFRGALHRWLRGRFGFLASALLTGAIFAALHPQGWLGIPALAAIGVGFSLLRESRDSLIAPMVAHSINNGVLVTMLCIAL
ncbi:MAG: CPBP family intramembrane metalloprotease [Verrucomicrobiales bacterium]|nr:CPBP family intramembrane metalloprotease [Verrucomicrobiales bacterium]